MRRLLSFALLLLIAPCFGAQSGRVEGPGPILFMITSTAGSEAYAAVARKMENYTAKEVKALLPCSEPITGPTETPEEMVRQMASHHPTLHARQMGTFYVIGHEMIVFDVKQAGGKTTINSSYESGQSLGNSIAQAKDKLDPNIGSHYRFDNTVTFTNGDTAAMQAFAKKVVKPITTEGALSCLAQPSLAGSK